MKPLLIFLVDDSPLWLKVMETQFADQTDYQIKTFSTGEKCLKSLNEKPDMIFLDYYLNSAAPKAHTGLEILSKIKAHSPAIKVVMLSAQEGVEVALSCMKHDAFDYIVKGETTFMRVQKSITVFLEQKEKQQEIVLYRTVVIILSILITVPVIIALLMKIYQPDMLK